MPYITTEVEIDVDLDDFDDDDIREEYEARGLSDKPEFREALTEIYQLRRLGKPFENELNKLICDALGVVI